MRSFALLALLTSSTLAIAGDCGAGRQGLFARRAERKAARSSCASCESATLTEETTQPAEIRTVKSTPVKTITGPTTSKTVIVPTGAAKSVAPSK